MATTAPKALIPVDEKGNPLGVTPGAAVTPVAAAPAPPAADPSSASKNLIPVDENGQPVTQSDWGGTAARTAARVAAGGADFLAGGTQGLGSQLEKWGVSAPTPTLLDTNGQPLTGPGAPRQPLPSEALIHGLGADAPSNMSTTEKTVESIAPWLVPNANMVNRISQVPSLGRKVMAGLWSEGGAAADWLTSSAAQEYAREKGYGPVAEMLAGLVGAQARGVGQRTLGAAAPALFGKGPLKDANGEVIRDGGDANKINAGGVAFDQNQAAGVTTPPLGDVAGPWTKKVEALIGGVPVVGAPVKAAYADQAAARGAPIAGSPNAPPAAEPKLTAANIINSIITSSGIVEHLSKFGWPGRIAHGVGAGLAATGMEDPSLVRAVAGRSAATPQPDAPLQQLIQRGGLGATAQAPTPLTKAILNYVRP